MRCAKLSLFLCPCLSSGHPSASNQIVPGIVRSLYPYPEYMGVFTGFHAHLSPQFLTGKRNVPRSHLRMRILPGELLHRAPFQRKQFLDLEQFPKFNQVMGPDNSLFIGHYLREGIEMGVNQNKIDNARRMKQKGFSTEDIAEITGLGKDEIDAI